MGCALGALNAQPVRIARRLGTSMGVSKGSLILGTRQKVPPDLAAFVNGLMVRYFDFNDTYLSKEPAHPSDNIGECLTISDYEDVSGDKFILSVVLAYEIQCRLCDAADLRHRGWDHVCYGLVSSAVASGILIGLSQERIVQAINIALNSHIAMRQVRAGELSMWKGCSFSNAARNGVFSALIAGEGMTGPSPIFEGEMGFFNQVSGKFDLDIDSFGGRNGSFKIDETYLKYFPAEIHSQSSIWAAIEVRKNIKDTGTVDSVEICSHEAGYTILGNDPAKWNPTNKETADHSLPYIVGMTLLEGKIDNSSYSAKKIRDQRILDLLKKTTVKEDKELTKMYPEAVPNRVTVKLSTGQTVSEQVNYHKGHPKNPMSEKDIEDKFRGLTKHNLGSQRTKKTLNTLWHLEKVKSMSEFLRELVLSK
ncbi:MAG: MmgE/PrpD family protein [Nitrososphaerota archaeon]|nr:MmgE/PrpD family protein [Nitrososphaerota archaeon]